jgi:hypothetical protein
VSASNRASQAERSRGNVHRNHPLRDNAPGSNAGGSERRKSDCRELGRHHHSSEIGEESGCEEVAHEEIDIVVAHIKRLARTASLEFALRVGAVIIHHFYGGDADAWRSRGPKTASFRRLAQHPDLPLSAGSLYRCVALYELCDRLNAPSRWEHLGASHLRVVIGLPPGAQEKLLATANSQRWTVKVLQQEVLAERATRLTRGGRRTQPPIARSLISVRKCLDDYRQVISSVAQLSLQDLAHSLELVEQTKTSLDGLSQSLQAAMSSANAALGEEDLLVRAADKS